MGLEYHNEVKNSFHLKIAINVRKKILVQVRFEPQSPGQKASHEPTSPASHYIFFFQKLLRS